MNSEAIFQLENVLANRDPDNEIRLERIRRLRDSLPNVWLTDEFLDFAKNEGRP